jgi:hypothetical protein
MNTHIPTLLLREWMQHKRGWLITAFAPPLIFLAILLIPAAKVQGLPPDKLGIVAVMAPSFSTLVVYGICLLIALFQLPGLARRDVQDRSIEFWLSLPGRPSESVAATVLAHAWLAPLGGLLVGAVLGWPLAAAVIAKQQGLAAIGTVPWGEVASAFLPMLLRVVAGTLLTLLWLAPVIFTLMAASAWLKRLGTPVVLVGGGVAVAVLYKAYDIAWPLEALRGLAEQTNQALFGSQRALGTALKSGGPDDLWQWAAHDFGLALSQLASLQFLGWAAVAAAGFALVVLKRTRAG